MDPASLHILTYPARTLRERAKPLTDLSPGVRAVADRMVELMREAEGIGLAAPQVGLNWRLFVAEIPPSEDDPADGPAESTKGPVVFINPVIERVEGAPEPFEEGCLSLPEIRGEVIRPPVVTVRASDAHGREFTMRCGGLLARCVQHEIDHLDGVLILDRMTQMARLKNRALVRDLEKAAPKAPAPTAKGSAEGGRGPGR